MSAKHLITVHRRNVAISLIGVNRCNRVLSQTVRKPHVLHSRCACKFWQFPYNKHPLSYADSFLSGPWSLVQEPSWAGLTNPYFRVRCLWGFSAAFRLIPPCRWPSCWLLAWQQPRTTRKTTAKTLARKRTRRVCATPTTHVDPPPPHVTSMSSEPRTHPQLLPAFQMRRETSFSA